MMRFGWLVGVLVSACAGGSGAAPPDIAPPSDSSASPDGANGGCSMDQLATNADASGQLTCTAIDSEIKAAIASRCSTYFGWLDSCDGCTTAPAKWGRVSASSCSPGVGAGNTCTTPTLAGTNVQMFGLDLDGDMDGNDKLHVGMQCTGESTSLTIAPCKAGSFVTGRAGTSWTCGSLGNVVRDFVANHCSIYLGWQDSCDGCTNPPSKWGRASATSCEVGAGTDNTCNPPTALDTDMVGLFGLNADGDVDGNDKFHIALHCDTPAPTTTTITNNTCPTGQFMVGTAPGGILCASPTQQIATYFSNKCSLYFGWRDNCNGCTDPPSKWGKVRVGGCMNGTGTDNTCSQLTLGTQLEMFGLSPDGNVDGNDTFYVGFSCD